MAVTVKDLATFVIRAFKTKSVPEAFSLLTAAFWETSGTKLEICTMISLTETDLRKRGNEKEANFCKGFREAIAAHEESVSYVWFIAEILRQTSWVQIPAPTIVAEEYVGRLKTTKLLTALVHVGRIKQRSELAAAEQRKERIGNFARRSLFAIGTLGGTELVSAVAGEDITDWNF